MCLPMGSCFGAHPTDDDHYNHAPAANKHGAPPPAPASRGQHHPQRNGGGGGHYNGGGDHYNVNGHYTGAQEKADGTLKQQPVARNGKQVAADGARGGAPAPHNYYSYERQPPAGREDAADSYCMAATAAADHQSPSEAFGGE